MKPWIAVFSVFIVLLVLGWVGRQDFESELAIEREYCMDVNAGLYGNFKELDCSEYLRSE
jgi:hypothetical protein